MTYCYSPEDANSVALFRQIVSINHSNLTRIVEVFSRKWRFCVLGHISEQPLFWNYNIHIHMEHQPIVNKLVNTEHE